MDLWQRHGTFSAFLAALLVVTVRSAEQAVSYCGNTPADVVFLLDSSNSMWGPDFRNQLQFAANVSSMFQIGPEDTQVALATFNEEPEPQFDLDTYSDKDDLIAAITNVKQSYGYYTATNKALNYMRRKMFSAVRGARPNVVKIGVVITDGQSENLLRTLIEASKARLAGIYIFTIGVGTQINQGELRRMASSPKDEYSHLVADFRFLDKIKDKLSVQACKITTPPPTTTTTTTTTSTTTTPTTTTTTTPTTTTTTTTTRKPTTTTRSTTTSTTTTTTTTTPPPTTTTTTTTTTEKPEEDVWQPEKYKWVNKVRNLCRHKAVDVVFAMDSSDDISHKDFWLQQKFVREFTMGLDIGPNKARVSVVLYSDYVTRVFELGDYTDLGVALQELYKMQRIYGGTNLNEVIRHVRTKTFSRSQARKGAPQILVLLTAGKSPNLHKVKREASRAKKNGVEIFVIGVGDRVNPEELKVIAAEHGGEWGMDFPAQRDQAFTNRRLWHLADFDQLVGITMEATLEACSAEVPSTPVSDQACGTRQEADVMFVADSTSAGKKNTKKTMDFMKSVTKNVTVGRKAVQMGMMLPEYCYPEGHSFRLGEHSSGQDFASRVQVANQTEDEFSRLLRDMRRSGFRKRKGGRSEAKKVAILLIDGALDKPLKALKEARRAKIKGIEVYIILVGQEPPQVQIPDMCAFPPQKHFFQVPTYDQLQDVEDQLIDILCDEL